MHILVGGLLAIALYLIVRKLVYTFPRFIWAMIWLCMAWGGFLLLTEPKATPIIVQVKDMPVEKEIDVEEFLRAPFIIYPGDSRYEEARRKQGAEKKAAPTADGPVAIKPLPRKVN